MEHPRRSRPDTPRAIAKTVSLSATLVAAIQEQAAREGHRNFSFIVVKAVQEYLRCASGKKVI